MADILLVHGSCHGAWCWHRVIPALERMGHRARAIDLPGHGQDHTPAAEVTLDAYAAAIRAAIRGPTVVVGHSMAGYAITAAAERDPADITTLVYLCAYVPVDGKSLADMRRAGPRQPLAPAIRLSADRVTFTFDTDLAPGLFYHDCGPGDRALAARSLCPQPVLPQETPLRLSARSAGLRRAYIRCTDDRAIPPEYQEVMAAGITDHTILPTSHSPFFAAPVALAERIDRIARGGV